MMNNPIFSRTRRRTLRSYPRQTEDPWLNGMMADELIARLDGVTMPINDVLVIGDGAIGIKALLQGRFGDVVTCMLIGTEADVLAEEDFLPFADAQFDLILACGGIDTIDDLPGALVLMLRALKPGGLFLGAMSGAGTLGNLKQLIGRIEAATGQAVARFHPQIDVRSAGDLLTRVGFSMAVADAEIVTARYRSLAKLRADIRSIAMGNALNEPRPLSREAYCKLTAEMDARCASDDGFTEDFAQIFMTGWRPVDGEVRPMGPTKLTAGAR
jgi:SAM-dependent methyltransferase